MTDWGRVCGTSKRVLATSGQPRSATFWVPRSDACFLDRGDVLYNIRPGTPRLLFPSLCPSIFSLQLTD